MYIRALVGFLSQIVLLLSLSAAPGSITINSLLQIKHPSDPLWSSDGRLVAYVCDEGGLQNLYVVNASGGQPVRLTNFTDGETPRAFWNSNSRTLFFERDGLLWEADVSGHRAAQASNVISARGSQFTLSPNGSKIAWVQHSKGGFDLVTSTLSHSTPRVVAHNETGIRAISWSPDGQSLSYLGGGKSINHDEAPAYSGAKILYRTVERTASKLYLVEKGMVAPKPVELDEDLSDPAWADNKHIVFETLTKDFKSHSILIATSGSQTSRKLFSESDKKFWSMPYQAGYAPQPSPDGKWLIFVSDRDGWDHIYVMPANGGDPVQITKGRFEAWRPRWSHDSRRIAFDANLPDRPGDRHLFIATMKGASAEADVQQVTAGEGTNIEPRWSPNDETLVYQHTDTQHSADLFAISTSGNARPIRLTNSMPPELSARTYVKPEFVHFPGAEGQSVPGWIFLPPNFERSKKYPAILWIHGDGINQNYDGWHVERHYSVYYSFHQYLLDKGYVVFAPDYRGSTGYGRDWRQGVYMDAGGKDAKDAWMGGQYLASLPYIDSNRIGVWGLSYGGFFTLIAVTDRPTLFRAGVDVAGVVDYRMYYADPYHGGWTVSRIGTPEQHPTVYDNASPVSHIDRLQRPLLILHGTADINVPYLESVYLVDQALKKGKGPLVDFMMYPGEFHYFDRSHVLSDAWRRVDEFFGKNVRDYQPSREGGATPRH